MAEVRKLWIVRNASSGILDDSSLTEGDRLLQFCAALDEGGYSMEKFLRIYEGTGSEVWKSESTKVYDDAVSARRDAEKRLAKLKEKQAKTAARILRQYLAAQRVAKRFHP